MNTIKRKYLVEKQWKPLKDIKGQTVIFTKEILRDLCKSQTSNLYEILDSKVVVLVDNNEWENKKSHYTFFPKSRIINFDYYLYKLSITLFDSIVDKKIFIYKTLEDAVSEHDPSYLIYVQ